MTIAPTTPLPTKEELLTQVTEAIQLGQELRTKAADQLQTISEKEVAIKAEKQAALSMAIETKQEQASGVK